MALEMAAVNPKAEPVIVAAAAVVVATAVPAPTTLKEDIMAVEGLLIKQKIELLEVMTGFETQNRYKVSKFQRDKMETLMRHAVYFCYFCKLSVFDVIHTTRGQIFEFNGGVQGGQLFKVSPTNFPNKCQQTCSLPRDCHQRSRVVIVLWLR